MQTLPITQIDAVVAHVDVECLAELCRPVGQLRIRSTATAFAHELNASNGRHCPDEHAPRHLHRFCDHVQAGVLAGPKDIGMSGRTEQHLGARGSATPGMGRWVTGRKIGFGLNDAAGDRTVESCASSESVR